MRSTPVRPHPHPHLAKSPGSPFFGTTLGRSDDLGATWSEPEARSVKFPEGSDLALQPTCVFESRDDIRWSEGFDTRVPDGSEVVVLPSVSGG